MDVYSFPFAYRSLTLNEHRTSAGALDPTKETNTIRVDRFDFSRLQQRDQREPLNLLTGGDLGDAAPTFRYLSLAGMIKGSNGMKLSDKIGALLQTFNVEEAQLESPSTDGLLPLTFTDVTELNNGRGTAWTDPRTGEAGFYVVEKFLARPAGFPIVTQRRSGGDSAGFAVELVCADPRRYCNTAEAVVLNSGNGFEAGASNWDTAQGWAVPMIVTIVTSANGASNFAFNAPTDAVGQLVLDLSAVGAATIVVDTALGTIKIGSTHRADLRTSTVDTLFARVPRGGGNVKASNTTNVTSVTVAYNQARG